MNITAPVTPRAFTLLELMVVTVVIGIVAISVIPASATIRDARRTAATDEVERLLVQARSRAISTGQPTAIEVSVSQGSLSMITLSTTSAVTSTVGPTGAPQTSIVLKTLFPGVEITSMTNPGGGPTPATIWFGHDGAPQSRDSAGVLTGAATSDSSITLTGGGVVHVRRISGLVER